MGRKTSKPPLAKRISRAAERGQFSKAWELMDSAMDQIPDSKHLTWTWLRLLDADPEAKGDRNALETALLRWEDEPRLVFPLCDQLLELVDGRYGDEPVPEDDPARLVIPYLLGAMKPLSPRQVRNNLDEAGYCWNLLARAYRLAGPEHDEEAIDAHSQALALDNRPAWRFNLGLFYKNRRRWPEALELFKELFEEDPRDEPTFWNLGICATALGEGVLACTAWRSGGISASVGDDGLPKVDRLGQVKVRLPGCPEDDPSMVCFEHVWVEPVSPCHGRVLNPTFYVGEVEMHDLVLWDGQPIGYVRHGERQIPRFAMLERLAGGGWRSFRFRAEQAEGGQLEGLSEDLPNESMLYVFDEQVGYFCAECIRTGGPHSEEHERKVKEAKSVRGKLLACPETSLEELRRELEEALARADVPGFVVPDFYEALGDDEALEAHRLGWEAL